MTRETVDVIILSDPDLPAEFADRLVGELAGLLSERVSDAVSWRVDKVLNPLAGDEQVSVDLMVEVVGRRMPELGWDYGVCLTDLPRRSGRRPVVAELSAEHGIALVSLPALGSLRLYPRVREAVVHLIGELHGTAPPPRVHPTGQPPRVHPTGQPPRVHPTGQPPRVHPTGQPPRMHPTGQPRRAHPLGRAEPGDVTDRRFVVPGPRGQLRLLAGMVRANRPWRLFLGLSTTLAGVFAVAAFALLQSDVWRIATALGPVRQGVLGVLAVAALVVWLIVDHELWERPTGEVARDRAVLYNTATGITLTLGVLFLYALLVVPLAATTALVLTPAVLGDALGRPPGWADYGAITWFMTSASMVGGALGAGLEDDSVVRQAAYGERQRQHQRLARNGPPQEGSADGASADGA
jgi:hypothetical protein